jgi:hypothetical protein
MASAAADITAMRYLNLGGITPALRLAMNTSWWQTTTAGSG